MKLSKKQLKSLIFDVDDVINNLAYLRLNAHNGLAIEHDIEELYSKLGKLRYNLLSGGLNARN